MTTPGLAPLASLVGDGALVPCTDGQDRPYLSCDAAASTPAFPSVLAAVEEFLPWYSSVHRGAGYKSQRSTDAYEGARDAVLRFAHRQGGDDVAIICRNTTEAINHLAYRLRLSADDVVVTTVVEHHANMLNIACGRGVVTVARCRVRCAPAWASTPRPPTWSGFVPPSRAWRPGARGRSATSKTRGRATSVPARRRRRGWRR